jgi:ABC-type nitrate/sulfonate/bicarbonate transport system substrate-binding protein
MQPARRQLPKGWRGGVTIQTIRLAVISEGTSSWPLYVAEARGLFARAGINVDMTVTGSSVKQLEQLIAGGYDIGFQQSDHVVRAVEGGADLFAFMAFAHAPELSLVAAPAIASLADLRGKTIVVDGARTGYALLLRKLLADNGLADGDYVMQEFGGSQERFDAMMNGAGAASLLNPPFDRRLFAAGFKNLGGSREFFPTYPGPIGATRRRWAAEHADSLVAFIGAMRSACSWLKDVRNKDDAIAVLPSRLGMDAKVAAAAFDDYLRQPLPQITPEGMREVIDVVWSAEGYRGAKGAPEKYMDLSFARRALAERA